MLTLSASNDKIKRIKKLSKKREREKSGEFIIEGKRSVTDAVANGAKISYIIFCNGGEPLFDHSIPQFSTDEKTFAEITDTSSPQDMLAVAKIVPSSVEEILSGSFDLLVLCDRVQDPGNVGTIIRTADAAGSSAVILSPGCADLYNPKVIRSTMSSVFNLPIVLGGDLPSIIPLLKKRGYRVFCGALREDSVSLFEADFRGKCAIVIGNEGSGASDEVISLCEAVKIPMRGKAESLNASVSAGILMYEVLRHNSK